MFERYTERAKRVIFFARYEAAQLGSNSIETEHLLLGLIREGKGLTSRIFAKSHLSMDSIRKEIEGRIVIRDQVSTSVEIPLSAESKRVLTFAAEEAAKRIYVLNHLAEGLDDEKTAKGVRFTPQPDGSGLYCASAAVGFGGKLASLCQGWQEPAEPDQALARAIDQACEDKPFYGKPALVKRRKPVQQRRVAPNPFPFGGPF